MAAAYQSSVITARIFSAAGKLAASEELSRAGKSVVSISAAIFPAVIPQNAKKNTPIPKSGLCFLNVATSETWFLHALDAITKGSTIQRGEKKT